MCEPQSEKELWIQFVEAYKKNNILWNPKHKYYNKKNCRSHAYDKLWKIYKKIHPKATVVDMCKKLRNMRTQFVREKEKVHKSIAEKQDYAPTLWYFDLFTFLDPELESLHFNTMANFDLRPTHSTMKITETDRTSRKIKTPKSIVIKEESDEEEVISPSVSEKRVTKSPPLSVHHSDQETQRREAPKRRVYNLLQKQERFTDTVGRYTRTTEAWEVQGMAIGLQLNKLQGKQRAIAEKLISDVIYFGCMGKLTENAAVNMNDTVVNVTVKHEDTDMEEEYLECDALGENDE